MSINIIKEETNIERRDEGKKKKNKSNFKKGIDQSYYHTTSDNENKSHNSSDGDNYGAELKYQKHRKTILEIPQLCRKIYLPCTLTKRNWICQRKSNIAMALEPTINLTEVKGDSLM